MGVNGYQNLLCIGESKFFNHQLNVGTLINGDSPCLAISYDFEI